MRRLRHRRTLCRRRRLRLNLAQLASGQATTWVPGPADSSDRNRPTVSLRSVANPPRIVRHTVGLPKARACQRQSQRLRNKFRFHRRYRTIRSNSIRNAHSDRNARPSNNGNGRTCKCSSSSDNSSGKTRRIAQISTRNVGHASRQHSHGPHSRRPHLHSPHRRSPHRRKWRRAFRTHRVRSCNNRRTAHPFPTGALGGTAIDRHNSRNHPNRASHRRDRATVTVRAATASTAAKQPADRTSAAPQQAGIVDSVDTTAGSMQVCSAQRSIPLPMRASKITASVFRCEPFDPLRIVTAFLDTLHHRSVHMLRTLHMEFFRADSTRLRTCPQLNPQPSTAKSPSYPKVIHRHRSVISLPET